MRLLITSISGPRSLMQVWLLSFVYLCCLLFYSVNVCFQVICAFFAHWELFPHAFQFCAEFVLNFFDLLLLCVFPTVVDGFDAFLESAGGCFDQEVAGRVRKFIYSAGNSRDPAEAYRLFRGRYKAYLFICVVFVVSVHFWKVLAMQFHLLILALNVTFFFSRGAVCWWWCTRSISKTFCSKFYSSSKHAIPFLMFLQRPRHWADAQEERLALKGMIANQQLRPSL